MNAPTLPAVLYHGTSTGYLAGMLARGLDPEASADGYLCYTDDLATARYHAEHMAEWDTGSLERDCAPIVFALPIARFDPEHFRLDANFIRLGPSHGRAVGQNLRERTWTWHDLLTHAGAVGYAARLSVTAADLMTETWA